MSKQSRTGKTGSPATEQKLNAEETLISTDNPMTAWQETESKNAVKLSEQAYNCAADNITNQEVLADFRRMKQRYLAILDLMYTKTHVFNKETHEKLRMQAELCHRWADMCLQQISKNTRVAMGPLVAGHTGHHSSPLHGRFLQPLADTSLILQQSTLRSRGANEATKVGNEDDIESLPSYGSTLQLAANDTRDAPI